MYKIVIKINGINFSKVASFSIFFSLYSHSRNNNCTEFNARKGLRIRVRNWSASGEVSQTTDKHQLLELPGRVSFVIRLRWLKRNPIGIR